MSELLPCHCGGKATMEHVGMYDIKCFIYCKSCFVRTCHYDRDDEASAVWNRRATPSPTVVDVERLRDLVAKMTAIAEEAEMRGYGRSMLDARQWSTDLYALLAALGHDNGEGKQ